MSKTAKREVPPNPDVNLCNGGWVRTWFSVDMPGNICIAVCSTVETNRMTLGETRQLIKRLNAMLRGPSRPSGGRT